MSHYDFTHLPLEYKIMFKKVSKVCAMLLVEQELTQNPYRTSILCGVVQSVLHQAQTSAASWGLGQVSQFRGGSGGSQGVHVC